MVADDLRSRIAALSPEERHELSVYLAKLELEDNVDYWETLRRRTAQESPAQWISPEQL